MQHLVGRGRLHVGSLPRLHSETLSLKTNGCGGGGVRLEVGSSLAVFA